MVVEKFPDTSDLYSDIGQITRCSKVDFDELEQKLTKVENDCRAAFEYLRVVSKHETPQVKTKYVLQQKHVSQHFLSLFPFRTE